MPSQALIDSLVVDNPESTIKDRGLYINDQMSIGNWHWNLGMRRDSVTNSSLGESQKDEATSVATGFLYAFDNGFSPYFSYADSFQPVVGLDAVSGAPFKPQEGDQIEAGVKYALANNTGYVTIAYFDIEQSNLLTQTPIGRTQSDGTDAVSGWELESKLFLGQFNIEANLSRLDTQTQDGFQFASVPETQASAWLGYDLSLIHI